MAIVGGSQLPRHVFRLIWGDLRKAKFQLRVWLIVWAVCELPPNLEEVVEYYVDQLSLGEI
jgi:hypothetical protein